MVMLCVILGLLFGWLFLKSGSVFVPALGHACFNLFAIILSLVTADFNPLLGGAAGVISMGIIALVAGALWFWYLISASTGAAFGLSVWSGTRTDATSTVPRIKQRAENNRCTSNPVDLDHGASDLS